MLRDENMAKKINNPPFGISCIIYRMVGETSFTDGEKVIVYDGVCDKQNNTSVRNFSKDNVSKADMVIFLPGIVDVREGDLIDYIGHGDDKRNCILVTGFSHDVCVTAVYFTLAKN